MQIILNLHNNQTLLCILPYYNFFNDCLMMTFLDENVWPFLNLRVGVINRHLTAYLRHIWNVPSFCTDRHFTITSHTSIATPFDMSSRLTRQHILAFAKHFTSDRHLCCLHSKKIKLSTNTAVQYSVNVWCNEYSKYTV